MFTRAEFGTYRANEWHAEVVPRVRTAGGRLVVWCHEHGAGGLTWPALRAIQGADAVTAAGLTAASADLGGTTNWGNPASVQAIDQLWALMQARWGVASDKLLLLAGSMGNMAAFNYARANPTKVAGIASILPAVDLADFHDRNPQGTDTTTIEAAYGGNAAYLAALPTSNPAQHALNGNPTKIPVRMWFSTNDTLALPTKAQYLALTIGAEATSMGAVGHSFNGLDLSTVATWLRSR